MADLSTLCFISEQVSYPEDYQNFGYEIHPGKVNKDRFYLTFEACLQSFGIKNRNQRMYRADNIMNCINTDPTIQDWLRHNNWGGNLDHPFSKYKDKELSITAISVPDMENTSHFIRRPRLEGNLLIAPLQTDNSNDAGMNMAYKIVDGKIIPCFSARVFGELDTNAPIPTVNVTKLITYDWVGYPSHPEAEAKIHQPIIEAAQNEAALSQMEDYANCTIIYLGELAKMAAASSKESNILCESFGLTMDDLVGVTATGNSVVFAENGNVFVQPITDRQMRNHTKSVLSDWFHQ